MLKILLAFGLIACGTASAQELHDITIDYEVVKPEEMEVPLVSNLPDCDNAILIEQVVEKIADYQKSDQAKSIIDQRRQALLVKNMGTFKELPIKDFDNDTNYYVADALIMTKINLHFTEDEMRLCQSSGKTNIYLLMYPENEAYRVQIINFVPPTRKGNDFSILYVAK